MVIKFDPDKIKTVREMKCLNQNQFAIAIGSQRQHVSSWEAKRSLPTIGSLLAIVNKFDIGISFFFVNK